jgi:hypothetical protein
MRVDEIPLADPGQDGPPWLWTGPGFPPEEAVLIQQKCAQRLLSLQRKFCLSGDPIHALTAQTWCQLYRVPLPPWAEVVIGQLAWSAIMAPVAVRGRKIRQVHWVRYIAVDDHLWEQRVTEGVNRPNKRRAYREVSEALRGQIGRGAWTRIEASYLKVAKAIRRGEVDRFAVGRLDNRYRGGRVIPPEPGT